MAYKYDVVKCCLPEYETGDVFSIQEFDNIEDAINLRNQLSDEFESEDTFYMINVKTKPQ